MQLWLCPLRELLLLPEHGLIEGKKIMDGTTEPVVKRYPKGTSLESLGIDPNYTLVGSLGVAGAAVWGDPPPPEPVGAVILVPRGLDGQDIGTFAILQSAEALEELKGHLMDAFDVAIAASRQAFENDGLIGDGGE